jgi:hypothetical protein
MRSAQTIWRSGGACLALLTACNSGGKRPEPRARQPRIELPRPAPPAEVQDAAPVASAVVQTLRAVHEQQLEITAPQVQPLRLAFGRGRLLQATSGKVVLRETQQGDVIAEAEVGAVRAVAQGSDGALFALGLSGGVRFEALARTPKGFPHVTFFPGSDLFPDLEEPSHFYVYEGREQRLDRYAFEAEAGALLPVEAQFSLAACTGALGLLLDGAFVCRSTGGIARQAPRAKRSEYALPSGVAEPVRLLPAKRLDELFSVDRLGTVVHLRLAAGSPVLGRFQLPMPPFAAAGNGEALAFVLVSPPAPNQSRRWRLLVTDFDGQPRLEADLPEPAASAADDWLEAATEDKNLAISGFEPLVAVGGAGRVGVWDYAQGRQRFTR